jgi:hypothetical protein
VCMFSECHGTHDHAKISKIAFQDTFVISGSFSPQCARFRLPPLIAQHAKLKYRSDDPRNHSKWEAVNYCSFRHRVNEFGCKLIGRYASKKNNAVRDVWFLSENKIREWTALSMPTLSMHNYCRTKCCVLLLETDTPLPRQQSRSLPIHVDRNSRPIHVPFRWAMLYGKYTPIGSCKPANYQNWATNYHKEK